MLIYPGFASDLYCVIILNYIFWVSGFVIPTALNSLTRRKKDLDDFGVWTHQWWYNGWIFHNTWYLNWSRKGTRGMKMNQRKKWVPIFWDIPTSSIMNVSRRPTGEIKVAMEFTPSRGRKNNSTSWIYGIWNVTWCFNMFQCLTMAKTTHAKKNDGRKNNSGSSLFSVRLDVKWYRTLLNHPTWRYIKQICRPWVTSSSRACTCFSIFSWWDPWFRSNQTKSIVFLLKVVKTSSSLGS